MPNSQDITAPFYPDVKLTEGHLKGIAKTRRGLIEMSHFDIKKLGDPHDSLLPLKCHSDLMCVGHKCLASLVWPHWYQKFNVFPPPYECLPWSQRDFPEIAGASALSLLKHRALRNSQQCPWQRDAEGISESSCWEFMFLPWNRLFWFRKTIPKLMYRGFHRHTSKEVHL